MNAPATITTPVTHASLATTLLAAADRIEHALKHHVDRTALVVGMSGIDGSGKSHLSAELARILQDRGLRVALIGVDPWQNPQSIRFGGPDPGIHFCRHCIRFDDFFAEVIEPLRSTRALQLRTRGMPTATDDDFELIYDFRNVQIVLVEGILLFRRESVARFDFRIWVDCSFATALHRAVSRNVEELPVDRLEADYRAIYHAAQHHHLDRDAPIAAAHFILNNDTLLETRT